mgnify:CR=1 FL=1
MRILHCVESYYPAVGGMPEVVRRLSEGLVHLGHEVTVATSHMQNRQSDFLNGIRIVSFTLAGRLADGIVGDPTEQRKYQEFIADPHFEVVVFFAAQQWSCDLALPVLHSITAKKVFVPTGFSGLHLPVFQDYYSLMPNWLLKYDMNVFLSNDYQDINFARAYGVKKYMIIPNGASAKEFLKIRDYDFRRDKSLPENSKILLLVGSHTGEKGHYEDRKSVV